MENCNSGSSDGLPKDSPSTIIFRPCTITSGLILLQGAITIKQSTNDDAIRSCSRRQGPCVCKKCAYVSLCYGSNMLAHDEHSCAYHQGKLESIAEIRIFQRAWKQASPTIKSFVKSLVQCIVSDLARGLEFDDDHRKFHFSSPRLLAFLTDIYLRFTSQRTLSFPPDLAKSVLVTTSAPFLMVHLVVLTDPRLE